MQPMERCGPGVLLSNGDTGKGPKWPESMSGLLPGTGLCRRPRPQGRWTVNLQLMVATSGGCNEPCRKWPERKAGRGGTGQGSLTEQLHLI